MAVQKSKKSRSRTRQGRSHHALVAKAITTDSKTGEIHLRHTMSADGMYRGRQIIVTKAAKKAAAAAAE